MGGTPFAIIALKFFHSDNQQRHFGPGLGRTRQNETELTVLHPKPPPGWEHVSFNPQILQEVTFAPCVAIMLRFQRRRPQVSGNEPGEPSTAKNQLKH